MSEEVKFSEEEMKQLKELQSGYIEAQNKFGQLSIAKLNLRRQADDIGKAEEQTKKDFEELQNKEREIVKDFTKKYGEGSLDPKTGVFTPSAKEENSN